LILQGETSSSSTKKKKIKTSPQAKRNIGLRRVFEREVSELIIIQLIEFYIASKQSLFIEEKYL